MALKKFPYRTVDQIVKKYSDGCEDSYTNHLLKKIKFAKRRGYLRKDEFILICNWKSARTIKKVLANSEKSIERGTMLAISSTDETKIISTLIKLNGVSIAMASAILMFINPKKYPVIDIRVWEVLYELEIVKENKAGKSLSKNNWLTFLEIIRTKAKEYKISARQVEKAIFLSHKIYQDGNLY